jgi:exodeoxyribonuclease VII large subunit
MATGLGGDRREWAIGDLNRRASLGVVKEFRGTVRVVGELARFEERWGNRQLELVERGGGRDGRDAHLGAFCSATKWQRLERKLAEAGVALQAGQRVVLVGGLKIGDRGTLMLVVDDVDVAALVGDRMRARRRLIQRLVDDDLLDANRRLPLPPLPLRIGVVASAGSEGHNDVVRQLAASGYAFSLILRSIPVEGPRAPGAIRAALATFGPDDVDVALLVRGGGAKASLDAFDAPVVALAIATAAVPVWTGIGHTGDRTVADEVAHRSFATPTEVGQAVVATVSTAWDDLARAVARIARLVDARLDTSVAQGDGRRKAVSGLAKHQLAMHAQRRAATSSELRRAASRCLDANAGQLTIAAHRIQASGAAELRDARRRLTDLALDGAAAARRRCVESTTDLAAAARSVSSATARALSTGGRPIDGARAQLTTADLRRRLAVEVDRAASRRAVLEAYDPRRQLARGWTLTHTADGRLLRHAAEVAEGDALVTTLAGGTATSTVTAVTRHEAEDAAS